jgi:hypothetical protein
MVGRISDIQPSATSACGVQVCQISGVDLFDYLERTNVFVGLQTDYLVDEAISDILDYVGWDDGISTWRFNLRNEGRFGEQAVATVFDPMFGSCSSCVSGLAFKQYYCAGLLLSCLTAIRLYPRPAQVR